MRYLSIILLLFFASFGAFSQQYIVEFEVENKTEIKNFPKYLSVDNLEDNIVTAYLWGDKNLNDFKSLGYDFEMVAQSSLGKVINMATTVAQMSNWDRYPTYEVYIQMMNQFETDYPDICEVVTIGTSVEGRELIALRITDNINIEEQEPEYFYTGTMHGDETTGFVLLLRLIDYLLSNYGSDSQVNNIVNNVDLYINPAANPDGTYHGGNSTVSNSIRYNASGTDLNRDFPEPLDANTPYATETQAMMDFADANDFVMSANFHGGTEVMNYPWDTWTSSENIHPDDSWFYQTCLDYVQTARIQNSSYMTSVTASGVTEGADWYYAFGSRQDYMTYHKNCKEVTIELSDSKTLSSDLLPAFWTYNKQSLLDYIEEVLYGFNGTVTNVNGDPLDAKIEIIGHDQDGSEAYTDAEYGDYYRPIAPGTYNVTYSSEGYISQTHAVTVTDWKTTTIEDVVLLQAAQVTLTGTVIDAYTNNPLEGVEISFPETSITSVTTNENGNYSVSLTENIYDITAYKNGYVAQTKTETINSGNANVDFALIPTEAITFETDVPTEITYADDADWFRSSNDAYEGTFSMESGDIDDNEATTMILTTTTEAGTISFYKKVSSEENWDKLHFYIDGVEQDVWSGEIDWSQESYAISEGSHVFKWSYIKDGSESDGSDCAWVDFIELPASSAPSAYNVTFTVVEGANPVENANVNLTGYGNLNTDAGGQCIFENVYESVNSIDYIVSASGYTTVTGNVTVDGNIEETVNLMISSIVKNDNYALKIQPNPSNGMFIVNSLENGEIVIFNSHGVKFFSTKTNSNLTNIDISNREKGIYILKFTTENGFNTQKIIVK